MFEIDTHRPDSDARPEDLQAHRAGYINRFGEYAEFPGDSYTDEAEEAYPYGENAEP